MDLQKKREDYVFVFLLVALTAAFVLWHLQLNPQQLPYFLVGPFVALVFAVLLALKPEYGRRFVDRIRRWRASQEELGGKLFHYQRIALILFFITLLTYPIVLEYKLVPSQYMSYLVLTIFIVAVTLSFIVIADVLKVSGKWGIIFITIIILIAVLRMLLRFH